MKRHFPDINTERTKGYAQLLTHNFDSVQESYCLKVSKEQEDRFQLLKEEAQKRLDGDEGLLMQFGGESFQIMPQGTMGKSWVLKNDDFIIMIGRGAKDWKISVRYLSAGLWEYGLYPLKNRILKCLLSEFQPEGRGVEREKPETWQRLTRLDYAFDFYSPEFSKEMLRGAIRPKMLLPSKVKGGLYFTSERDETIWFGIGSKSLQIQVYDKGKEINDKCHKSWMYQIYEREGYYPPEDLKGIGIWRVEIRLYKEYIKNRKCLTLEDVTQNLKEFLCEALAKRRLCQPNGDSNKARWGLHPLWAEVLEEIGGAGNYMPIGKLTTLSAEEKLEGLKANIAGTLRSACVLRDQAWEDDIEGMIFAQDCAVQMWNDKEHEKKINKALEKYRFEREAN